MLVTGLGLEQAQPLVESPSRSWELVDFEYPGTLVALLGISHIVPGLPHPRGKKIT